ncbi:MAG: hypothetical protein EPN37_13085 [Chitinophagaceae bacterium]|nr:MAG: hypothetical protein EPN37_13085 [Chitinophagaceae bacterium]
MNGILHILAPPWRNGTIEIMDNQIQIELKKKRDLPQILEMMKGHQDINYKWLGNRKMVFFPSSTS